jgi:hypothetical protein
MDPTEVARRDQVVDMHVPQRGAIPCLVFAKQPLELTQARWQVIVYHSSREKSCMAAKTTLNAKNLETLGSERLAELLIEISNSNAPAKRRLRLELGRRSEPW